MSLEVKEIQATSVLSPANVKDTYDFSLNPYVGCQFGCSYCYASFTGRYVQKTVSDWGEYVYAKINAPALLSAELKLLRNHGRGKSIWFSSVTDPYQGMEVKYQLTRQCLQVLMQENYQGSVLLLTKSDLVTRDIDILKKIPNLEVGMSVTTTSDAISQYFEKHAPPVSKRLIALKKLHDEGIHTFAFIGPLLPHFVDNKRELEKLIHAIKKTGIGSRDIYVEHLLLNPYIRTRMQQELKDMDRVVWDTFYASQSNTYKEGINVLIQELLHKQGLTMQLSTMLFRRKMI